MPHDEAKNCALQWNVPYIEASAKTCKNVEQIFFDLLRMIDKKKQIESRLALDANSTNTNRQCCTCILL